MKTIWWLWLKVTFQVLKSGRFDLPERLLLSTRLGFCIPAEITDDYCYIRIP